MAFDDKTRGRLQRFVAAVRELLSEEFTRQLQQVYGLDPRTGEVTDLDKLRALDNPRRDTARLLRETLEHYEATSPSGGKKEALARIVREQAFTVLNRLCALRMAEARDLLIESVARGYQSKGFQLYTRVIGTALGEMGDAYRCYLFSVFDEFALDLPVLFDRFSPQGRLFPREATLLQVLQEINHGDLEPLWAEDETIGWIYQYFNSAEERRQMRAESAAPRNSRELAVRNQFFTPRYVVAFLTDNTLGRIWYEMTQGNTGLTEYCAYLVRRPTEVFLKAGEEPPETAEAKEDLSQEELLKQPVYVAFRPLKDPRDIKMLDPACGSMHFGLYAFDLFERIYAEAWDLEETVGPEGFTRSDGLALLRESYESKEVFLREVPRLIFERNIHGIDIDPRAVQIAGLSLWLRAHKSWYEQGVKPQDRPQIRRSNVVCAEPMPGDEGMLEAFLQSLRERGLESLLQRFHQGHAANAAGPTGSMAEALCGLVRAVWQEMRLAGEAGSLLKVEESLGKAIERGRKEWGDQFSLYRVMEFTLAQPPKAHYTRFRPCEGTNFWDQAEWLVLAALELYAEQAENGDSQLRRLFSEDAARGFAFIDLCRKRYDVVVMNPPFGDGSLPSKPYIEETYGDTKGDVYKAFVECFQGRLVPAGFLGIISSRAGFFLGQSEDWRTRVVLRLFRPIVLADLGIGVLDAMVEVAAYVLRALSESECRRLTLSLVTVLGEVALDRQERFSLTKWQAARNGLKRHQAVAELDNLAAAGFVKRCPGRNLCYAPLWHKVRAVSDAPGPVFPPLVCVRALDDKDKAAALDEALHDPRNTRTYVCSPGNFTSIPGHTFAYWVSKRVMRLFKDLPAFESNGRIARQGGVNGDDFRYLRAWWESPQRTEVQAHCRWTPYAKGGDYSRFYLDLALQVYWDSQRTTFAGFAGLPHRPIDRPASYEDYFRRGITWSRRSQRGLSLRVLPEGCVFSDKGPSAFVADNNCHVLTALLALMNSTSFRGLVALQMAFGSYEVGVIQRTPIPDFCGQIESKLGALGERAWLEKYYLDSIQSSSHAFRLPALVAMPGPTLACRAAAWSDRVRTSEKTIEAIQEQVDELSFQLYGLDDTDRAALTVTLSTETGARDIADTGDDEEAAVSTADTLMLTADLLEYALGTTFGRWDVRFASGERSAPEVPGPFMRLPVCPPSQLQDEQGLPISKEKVEKLKEEGRWCYPIEIPWDGILPDDHSHLLDCEARVRQALQAIWEKNWEAVEREACEILGVGTLRDYFRKPSRFFAEHLRRYSKSRRQAPIYWPLSTPSGSYTLWIYYHRLTDQTLYNCVNDFLDGEGKLKQLAEEIRRLRHKVNRSSTEESELEQLTHRELELKDFRSELLRIAKFWKPNLNDGVQITAAPLWKLFQYRPWQKRLKETWESLENGDYDWAHLAYAIWPERVREKCKTDKSLAIAHGLEALYQEPTQQPRSRRGRRGRDDLAKLRLQELDADED